MTDGLSQSGNRTPFAALRRLARQVPAASELIGTSARGPEEQCDLCGEAIGPEHRHLLDLTTREALCACRACTMLFDQPLPDQPKARPRLLIPTRLLALTNLSLTDAEWASLQVPVNMAYFCHIAAAKRVTAFYPSPMGPTEAVLPPGAWEVLAQSHPILGRMASDVEALLIRRERDSDASGWSFQAFLVPIDVCYQLVGLIRLHWRGLSGGTAVRTEVEAFFERLTTRATPETTGGVHA
jgi:hypothetical protein